jgi:hypothetical protein
MSANLVPQGIPFSPWMRRFSLDYSQPVIHRLFCALLDNQCEMAPISAHTNPYPGQPVVALCVSLARYQGGEIHRDEPSVGGRGATACKG